MKFVEVKLVTTGKWSVGKTSIVKRYVDKSFEASTMATIAAAFFSYIINLDDFQLRLSIWDTAGAERFKAIAPMYYRDANAVLMVFDMTNYETFEYAKSVYQDLKNNCDDNFVLALVANKLDLGTKRMVTEDEARDYASLIGATYHETSALADIGIDEIFETTAAALVGLINKGKKTNMKIRDYLNNRNEVLNLVNENDKKTMCCYK